MRKGDIYTRKVVLLSLLPIIVTGLYILRLGLNIPFWDQWTVVALLAKKYQGLLSLADLFGEHLGHRPFFPRLIWIGLSEYTGYNVNAELWVNFLIALGTFWFFVNRSMKAWSRLGVSVPPMMVPLMSLLVFNLGQHESWLQGFQTVMFLGVAAVVVGLFLLAEDSGLPAFLVAAMLGVVATFSMASGLLYWFVGLAVLAVSSPHRSKAARWFLWTLASTISIVFFFNDWAPGRSPNLGYEFAHPLQWYLWVVNFLGAPLLRSWYVAWIFGMVSISLYVLALGHAVRTNRWRQIVAYLAIAIFVLLMDFSVSSGRMSMGMPQSVVSRYLTVSVWYWTSLLALIPMLQIRGLYRSVLYASFTISLMVQMVLGGRSGYVAVYRRLLPAYMAVSSGQTVDDSELALINWDLDLGRARSQLDFLCEHRLSACAHAP